MRILPRPPFSFNSSLHFFFILFLFSSSFTCILRFLAVTNDPYQKCPLCSERFNKNGLKSVKFTSITIPDSITFESSERHDKEKEKEKDKEKVNRIKGKEKNIESSYSFQLLSIEKDALFPILPCKERKSASNRSLDLSNTTAQSMKSKKPPFNYSSFAPGLHPSITTLSEVSLATFVVLKGTRDTSLRVVIEGCKPGAKEE